MGRERTEEGDPIPVGDPTEDLSNSSEDRQKAYEEELTTQVEGEEEDEEDDEDETEEDEDDEENEGTPA